MESTLFQDLRQFVTQDFHSVRKPMSHKTLSTALFVTFFAWFSLGLIALVVIGIAFGYGWYLLLIPYIFVTIFFGRFGQYHAKKHGLARWW